MHTARLLTISHSIQVGVSIRVGLPNPPTVSRSPVGRPCPPQADPHPVCRQTPPNRSLGRPPSPSPSPLQRQTLLPTDVDPPPVDRTTDTHVWKHYLPATSFAGGNNLQLSSDIDVVVVYGTKELVSHEQISSNSGIDFGKRHRFVDLTWFLWDDASSVLFVQFQPTSTFLWYVSRSTTLRVNRYAKA